MTISNMSHKPLPKKILDRISEEVMGHVDISVAFERQVRELDALVHEDPSFKEVRDQFELSCDLRSSGFDLSKDRRELRAKLHNYFDGSTLIDEMIRRRIEGILRKREHEIKTEFTELAGTYLRTRFLPRSPPPVQTNDVDSCTQVDIKDDIDMEIESSLDESPQAPEFSPISNPDPEAMKDKINEINNHLEEPHMTDIKTEQPSLEDIPIPPDDECPDPQEDSKNAINCMNMTSPADLPKEKEYLPDVATREEAPPTPVRDEPHQHSPLPSPQPQEEDGDELEKLTFSSVSSVNTADLSDFDESIKLSDDEANIVGRPRNCKIPIKVLQGTISDLQTKSIDSKLEASQVEQPIRVKLEQLEQSETGESDGCSEGTSTGRRATRKRKSNPRYDNENYTSF